MATDDTNTEEQLIDNDIPDMHNNRGGNSKTYVIGMLVIAAIGLGTLMYIMAKAPSKDDNKAAPESLERGTVENDLPALVVPKQRPVKPVVVEAEKEKEKPIKKPIFVQPVKPAQPVVVKERSKPKEKVVHWYDRKMSKGTLQPEQADIKTVRGNKIGENDYDGFNLSGDGASDEKGDLSRKLVKTETPMAVASMLPDRNYIIAQGTSLDCALETALDSSLSGITTCILSRDVYSDNGRVLLLDRGSKLTGEYTGGLKNGQKRLFVLWTRAKTPNGVVVSLNSPSADGLGRSGMSGWVDTHFLERFGTAIFLSVLSDGAKIYAANNSDTSGGVVIGNAGESGADLGTEILEYQADIPPTLTKNQGETIKVMVARDLDFRGVYNLQLSE